jgi:2-C-methyl-D-erythritol 4-phosphate cytidylyltransferase
VTKVWSIVVAGGSGERFGQMKQFSLLGGRPVLEWAVEACRPVSAGVVLVLPLKLWETPGQSTHGADVVVPGGPTREDSVRAGLAGVPMEADVIVVHDAARPVASRTLFRAVVQAVTDGGADGAVPGLTPRDTIKVVDDEGQVKSTFDRNALVAVQTPQAFRAEVLRRAHEQGPFGATDDAMLVEALGGRVKVVAGDPGNLKITTPEDLLTAERLLAEMPAEGG